MGIIPETRAGSKAAPHDPLLCGIDRETTCRRCRASCWPEDEFLDQQALEVQADDEAVMRYRLIERPARFRGEERAYVLLVLLRLAKSIRADEEFRGVLRFVFEEAMGWAAS